MSVIGELASFVAGAKASGLPAADRERLRLHFIDTVVAARVGALIPEGRALQSLGDGGALADRIGRQAAAIRLTEIDDIHLPSCTTPSAGVVPVALMLAAREQKLDPGEVASAIWVGTEIMTRIGVAVRGPQILYRGIWPTYLAAQIAAAAASARLMGLNQARTGHALSLAVMLWPVALAVFTARHRAMVSICQCRRRRRCRGRSGACGLWRRSGHLGQELAHR